jgi:hypothetical protein
MNLVITSALFAVPAAIAHVRRLRKDCLLASTVTSCSIMNHSYASKNEAIRKVDISVAHAIGTFYTVESLRQPYPLNVMAPFIVANSLYLYYCKSNNHNEPNTKMKKLWHGLMHISVAIGWSLYLVHKE